MDEALRLRWLEHLDERDTQRRRSTQLWRPDPNRPGMKGELALAEFFGAVPDLRDRPQGDNNIDLEVLLMIDGVKRWIEIDAKGSPTPYHLIVAPKGLARHRIYVLAGPVNHLYVNTGHLNTVPGVGYLYDCLGWQWGHEMLQQPLMSFGYGASKHAKLQGHLHTMAELKSMYVGQWRHHGCEPRPAKTLELVGFDRPRQVGAWTS
jgi:hypothetical protein